MEKAITVSALIEAATKEGDLVKKVIEELHEAFRTDGRRRIVSDAEVNLAALARHVHYTALSLADERRSETTSKRDEPRSKSADEEAGDDKRLTPAWKPLLKLYDDLSTRAALKLGLVTRAEISDDDISQLCYFKTGLSGTQKKKKTFYASMAILLLDLKEKGRLDTPYLRYSLPASERDFAGDLARYIARKLEDARKGEESETYPQFSMTFKYDRQKLASLERFHTYFRNTKSRSPDRCSHFICYRPRKSNPTDLIKTFLAIKPPEASGSYSKSFNFVHVYQATPSDADKQRVALGKILPLHEGLYFVGGQKEHQPEDLAWRSPFKTLKVIAVGWRSVENLNANINGLVMSANNEAEHIVSRIVLRASPISHSGDLTLGAVSIRNLWKDITDDTNKEIEILKSTEGTKEEYSRYGLRANAIEHLDELVEARMKRVLTFCNNDTQWKLPEGFKSADGASVLTESAIEKGFEDLFGSKQAPRYVDSLNTPFEYPESVRFGVLSRK